MVIGGVTGALRGGVAVNISDALRAVRGEERPAGPTNQPAETDGLMGSEIEASGRLDQTDFLHGDGTLSLLSLLLCWWWWPGGKLGSKVTAAPITAVISS